MKFFVVLSVGWRIFLSILAVTIGTGIYWYHNPLAINLQIVPYGSCRIRYKLFDKKVIADNFIINKQKIYISPIAIPLTKDKIPRIYIEDSNGYIIIKNLRPLSFKNNYIEIEAKNFDLYKILKKPILKGVMVTTHATFILLDNNQFGLNIKHLLVTNTPLGDIKTQLMYLNNKLDMVLKLLKYNHTLKCVGFIDLNKLKKWDIKLSSQNTANIRKLKIKDIEYSADIEYTVNWRWGLKNERLLLNIVSDNISINNLKTKCIDLGKVKFKTSYLKNQVNSTLELLKFNHTALCTGTVQANEINLNITAKNPINIKQFKFVDNLIANCNAKYNIQVKRADKSTIFTGSINIANGDIRNIENDILVKNIIGNFELNNKLLLLKNFEAESFNFVRCNVYATGKLDIASSSVDVQITIPKGNLCNVPYVKSDISTNIQVDGDIRKPFNITGSVRLINPVAEITSIISNSVIATDITNHLVDNKPPLHLNKIKLPINADIKLEFTPKININGSGLTSTWKGVGWIKSEAGKPIIWDVKLNAINGKYALLKKKIKLSSGEILSNPHLVNYYKLNLTAKKKVDNKEFVGIKFSQYNNNTTIDFFSSTMKNKQDILSLFLFDKPSTELTTSEVYSLGMLVQDITTGNENIFEKMNKLLKIDTLEVKHHEDGSNKYNSVVVGKKIGKWALNFQQGKSIDETELSIKRTVKKQAKVGISLSKNKGLEGGISWNKRY